MLVVFVVVWRSLLLLKQGLAEGHRYLHGFQQPRHYANLLYL